LILTSVPLFNNISVAELILLTVGLIMVLDPLIESFKSHISPFHGKGELSDSSPTEERNRTLLARVASFLRLLVLGILATGIAGEFSFRSRDPSHLDASMLT